VSPSENDNVKRLWRVKDTIFSPWRDLPGIHTSTEIWQMRNEGRFVDATSADETLPKGVASDN
jgi:hypothetical protein